MTGPAATAAVRGPDAPPTASICTVVTPAHTDLFALNAELVRRLNPDAAAQWMVTFNPDLRAAGEAAAAGQEAGQALDDFRARHPQAQVLPGPTLRQTYEAVLAAHGDSGPEGKEHRRLLDKYVGSYHHAEGLALALRQVGTRYAVVMDPDFYVVRPGWIAQVLETMETEGLALFGAPWNPRWYQKYRAFPCTHLMVIDLHRCPWAADLMHPDLVRGGRRYASPLWSRYAQAAGEDRVAARRELVRHPVQALLEDLRQRASIGSARDTGYGLLGAFLERPELKVGLAQPVFHPGDGFMPAAVSPLQAHPLVEALLPARRRYLPRGKAAPSPRGFEAFGRPSFRASGWEEFLWKGAPFAFHVRGEMQRRPGGRIDAAQVRQALAGELGAEPKPRGLEPEQSLP